MEQNLEVETRQRAYELWEQEGRPDGRDREHWLQAEAEINESTRPQSRGAAAVPQPAEGATPSDDRGA